LSSGREEISSEAAPEAIGPYSQAILHGDHLFCSGQIPIDPETGDLVVGGVAEQTERCLANLEAICSTAGTRLAEAVRLTVYTTALDEFSEINRVFAAHFAETVPPARAMVGVAQLPLGAQVEIDAIVASPAGG